MKEHPIIFSAESVRAILDGRKTQTRRVVKATHHYGGGFPSGYTRALVGFHSPAPEEHLPAVFGASFRNDLGADWLIACPYGAPGDRLWVRETWARAGEVGDETEYCADNDDPTAARWRPSIHMPRWASRLTLEVVSVRVERVQKISEKDAIAESPLYTEDAENLGADVPIAVSMFAHTWDAINGKKPGRSWKDNPWVWVIEFRRVE